MREESDATLRLLQTLLVDSRRLDGFLNLFFAPPPKSLDVTGALKPSFEDERVPVLISLRDGRRVLLRITLMLSTKVPSEIYFQRFII